MTGQALAPWELRSAILSGRAATVDAVAADVNVALTEDERQTLRTVAGKLRTEAFRTGRRETGKPS
jgi:hypothetical protein